MKRNKQLLALFVAIAMVVLNTKSAFALAPGIDIDGSGSGTSNTVSFTEGSGGEYIAATDATITDPDSTNLVSMTVTLTNAMDGDSVVSTNALPGVVYNTNTSVPGQVTLTITGSVPVSDYETLLRGIQFRNLSDNPSTTQRTITVTTNDGSTSSVAATAYVNVTAVNDPPVIGIATPIYIDANSNGYYDTGETNASFTNGSLAADAIYNRKVDLPAGANLNDLRVILDVMANDNAFRVGVNGTYLTSPSVIQLSSSDTSTLPQAYLKVASTGLDLVQPWTANIHGLPRVRVIMTNGSVEFWGTPDTTSTALVPMQLNGGNVTLPVFVSGQNTVTAVSVNGGGPDSMSGIFSAALLGASYVNTYTENGSPVGVVSPNTSAWDNDNATLQSATLTITDPVAGDYLVAGSLPAGITASYDALTHTMTLSGAASASDYTLALKAIQFASTSDNPTNADRHIDITVSDGTLSSNTAATTIHVVPLNDNPVDPNDTNTTSEDTPLNVDAAHGLLSGASDPDGGTLSITSFSIAGQSGPFVIGTAYAIAGVGTITIHADGSYEFAPAAEYSGTVPQISYTLSDGNGGTDSSTLDITVTPVNDPPVDPNDTNTTSEDTPLNVDAAHGLLNGATDIDSTNLSIASFSIAGESGPFVVGVPYAISGVGVVTISANGSYTFVPAANYNGTVPLITYVVSDGDGGTDTSTLSITVTPTNDAPVANNDNATTPEDVPVTINVLANDDPIDDPLDPTSVVITSAPTGATLSADGKSLVVPGEGTWTVNATTGAITFTPALNYNGSPTPIAYTVKDMAGAVSNTATLTVVVTPVNDPPVNDLPSNQTASSNGTVTFTGSNALSVTDPDGNLASVQLAVLHGTLNVDLGTSGATITGGANGSKTLTISGTQAQINAVLGALTYTASAGYSGSDTLSVLSLDAAGTPLSDADTLQITGILGASTTLSDTGTPVLMASLSAVLLLLAAFVVYRRKPYSRE